MAEFEGDEDFAVADDMWSTPAAGVVAAPTAASTTPAGATTTATATTSTPLPAPAPVAAATPAAAAAAATTPAPAQDCEMCECDPAVVQCTACESAGIGRAFCEGCSDQVHSSAKGKLHQLVDMSGKTIGGAMPATVTGGAAATHATIPTHTPSAAAAAVASKPAEPISEDDEEEEEDAPAKHVAAAAAAAPIASAVSTPTTVTTAASAAAVCESCEEEPSTVTCGECRMAMCPACDKDFHTPAKMATHKRVPIGGAVQAPISTPTPVAVAPVSTPPPAATTTVAPPVTVAPAFSSISTSTSAVAAASASPVVPVLTRANSVADHFADQKRVRLTSNRGKSPFLESASSPATGTSTAADPLRELCNSCLDAMVQLHCRECVRDYCTSCDSQVHITRDLKKHTRTIITAEENMITRAKQSDSPHDSDPLFPAESRDLYDSDVSTNSANSASAASSEDSLQQASSSALDRKRSTARSSGLEATAAALLDRIEEDAAPAQANTQVQQTDPTSAAVDDDDDDDDDDGGPVIGASLEEYNYANDVIRNDAATRLQSVQRGRATRKDLKDKAAVKKASEVATAAAAKPVVVVPPAVVVPVAIAPPAAVAPAAVVPDTEDAEDDDDYGDDDSFDTSTTATAPITTKPAEAAPVAVVVAPPPPTTAASQAKATPVTVGSTPDSDSASASAPASAPAPAQFEPEPVSPSEDADYGEGSFDEPPATSVEATFAPVAGPKVSAIKPVVAAVKSGVSPHEKNRLRQAKLDAEAELRARELAQVQAQQATAAAKKKAAAAAAASAKKKQAAPKSKAPAPKQTAGDDYDDDTEETAGAGAGTAAPCTVIEQLFMAMAQDPSGLGGVASPSETPLLEGIILPTTVVFRAARPTAIYYTDPAGFVRHHAWRKAAAHVRAVSPSRAAEPLSRPGREALSPVRAVLSGEAAGMLGEFPSSLPANPSAVDSAAMSELDALRMFTPNLRASRDPFLKRGTHKRRAQAEEKEDSAVVAAAAEEPQYTEAYQRARARGGYINIEQWKKEERLLAQARQRAQHALEEKDRAAREEADRLAAEEQEQQYVGLLIFTAVAEGSSTAALPAPVALTLGQVRKLFRAAVLAPARLPSAPAASLLARHDFVLQKIEYAPGASQMQFRVRYDERVSVSQVQVYQARNNFADSQQSLAQRSLAHEGIRQPEAAYVYKGPAADMAAHTEEAGPLRYDETHRRFKRVVFALLRRVQEAARQGLPSVLQCYFQQGVAMPPPAPNATMTFDSAAEPIAQPGEVRRKPWFILFGDLLEIAAPARGHGDGTAPGSPGRLHVLSTPGSPLPRGQDKPHLYRQDSTTGETILPALAAYSPMVVNPSASVDRSECAKCKVRLGMDTIAGPGSVVMLKALLLKWVPNSRFEYPEQMFESVLGVDEDPSKANWHRTNVACCGQCLGEIRALRTIPSRTQLAPWLASLAVPAVPAPVLDHRRALSGTTSFSASITIPMRERGAHQAAQTASPLPGLLPYLAKAPVLHSRGSGHAGELIPAVAFVARKNVSLLETQGVIAPQGGLALPPRVEMQGNRGGLVPRSAQLSAPGPHKHSMSHAASVPNLGHSSATPGVRGRKDLGMGDSTGRSTFSMSSSYMDERNPHEHPTHMLTPVMRGGGLSSVRKGFALASEGTSPLKEKLLSPNAHALAATLGHSSSAPFLANAKSPVAGGKGTAPMRAHQPIAAAVILSPVKAGAPMPKGKTATQAWGPGPSQKSTASPARLPTITSKPASAAKKPKQPSPVATSKPTAQKAPAANDEDEDDYGDDDTFDDGDAPNGGAAAVTRPWWDEATQAWSYDPYPTDYSPVIYDPAVHGDSSAGAAAPDASEPEEEPYEDDTAEPDEESIDDSTVTSTSAAAPGGFYDDAASTTIAMPKASPPVHSVDEGVEEEENYDEEDF